MIDIHALVGAYAVDALDEDERAAFEEHLAGCPTCQDEVAGLRETAALLGTTAMAGPPDRLRDRVLADIDTVRPIPPRTEGPTPQRRRRFRPALLAAAAAAVIGLGAGTAVVQPWQDSQDGTGQTQPSAADRIRSAADAETFTQRLADGAEATVIRSADLNEAVLLTKNMPAPPSGKVYELWLNHEGAGMVPAGLMTGDEGEVVLEGDPADAIGFGITVEPAGGSEEPSRDAVTTISFQST